MLMVTFVFRRLIEVIRYFLTEVITVHWEIKGSKSVRGTVKGLAFSVDIVCFKQYVLSNHSATFKQAGRDISC